MVFRPRGKSHAEGGWFATRNRIEYLLFGDKQREADGKPHLYLVIPSHNTYVLSYCSADFGIYFKDIATATRFADNVAEGNVDIEAIMKVVCLYDRQVYKELNDMTDTLSNDLRKYDCTIHDFVRLFFRRHPYWREEATYRLEDNLRAWQAVLEEIKLKKSEAEKRLEAATDKYERRASKMQIAICASQLAEAERLEKRNRLFTILENKGVSPDLYDKIIDDALSK